MWCIGKLINDRIVSYSIDETINLNSGECLKILRGHGKRVASITVYSDDKIVSVYKL